MIVRLVLDVLDRAVVRAVAGKRDEYRPIESVLTPSTAPRDVAAAFRDRLGVTAIHVADLDGILRGLPDVTLLRSLVDGGFDVLADVGIASPLHAVAVAETGIAGVVCGLETLGSPDDLLAIVQELGPERTVFGLDLLGGRPLGRVGAWPSDPHEIARLAAECGVARFVVLDLAAVGTGSGVPTLPLCREIRSAHPGTRLITGGGIRTRDDLAALAAESIDEVLVASAVHDGTLVREDLAPAAPSAPPVGGGAGQPPFS